MFKLCSFLGWLGFFRYDGLPHRAPAWWPRAQVVYTTGLRGLVQPIGNAWEYAKLDPGARVVPALRVEFEV